MSSTPHNTEQGRNGSQARTPARFAALDAADAAEIERMSALASAIVKEHFDPIIGAAQNDYMITRFQSVDAIRDQIGKGYRYYFVTAQDEEIGFLAFVPRGRCLYLSKFYLQKDQRGKGLAWHMLAFVVESAQALGLDAVELNVNRNNDARFAYEKMGFAVEREEVNDIGGGYVMDDYVYALDVNGWTASQRG